MHMIVYAILAIVLSSTSSRAEPAFLAGSYVPPITQHDLYVSAPGPLGMTVTVNLVQTDRKLYRYTRQCVRVPVATWLQGDANRQGKGDLQQND
jgi:hypothetical protein